MHSMKPKLAITMGDPAGIGPEIVIKALHDANIYTCCDPIVFGDVDWMRRTAKRLKIKVNVIDVGGVAATDKSQFARPDTMLVHQSTAADLSRVSLGVLS